MSDWMGRDPWKDVVDDTLVESAVRAILEPLDRSIDRSQTALGCLALISFPGALVLVWYLADLSWYAVIGVGVAGWVGILIVLLLFSVGWDELALRRARNHFDANFPLTSPLRESAVAMLKEMESPTDAEEKLLKEVSANARIQRVRRKVTRQLTDAGTPDGQNAN